MRVCVLVCMCVAPGISGCAPSSNIASSRYMSFKCLQAQNHQQMTAVWLPAVRVSIRVIVCKCNTFTHKLSPSPDKFAALSFASASVISCYFSAKWHVHCAEESVSFLFITDLFIHQPITSMWKISLFSCSSRFLNHCTNNSTLFKDCWADILLGRSQLLKLKL